MKEQKSSEDQLIISRHEAKSSNPVRNYSETIPLDLIMDIFSRVPAKSIARFHCVSKFWASILACPNFTELFLTKSSNRPKILFAVKCNARFFIFTSPQPQNPEENCSLVATRYKYHNVEHVGSIFQHLLGLVYLYKSYGGHPRGLRDPRRFRYEEVICNPITRELLILPTQQTKGKGGDETSYLCYDPTNKQFKMFRMTWPCLEGPVTHLVMTLETRRRCWRRIECKPYSLCNGNGDGICINGMLYYKADNTIVCFDVRYEKFSFISINVDDVFLDFKYYWILTNYKGKLGVHLASRRWYDEEIVLWVLEDAVNNTWSKNVCILSPLCLNKDHIEYRVGVTCGGEIVFSPDSQTNPFYIIYYNFEKNTFTKVEIQGLPEVSDGRTYIETFLNYVENMKLMKFRSEDDDECRRSKRPKNPNPVYR